jgi:hypothetical protein
LDDKQVLEFEDPVRTVEGLFDLPMIAGERITCEALYHQLTGGPDVEMTNIDGTFLKVPEENVYLQIHDEFLPKPKPGDLRNSWERRGDVVRYPIGTLPDEHVFVVRTGSLASFLSNLQGHLQPEKPLAPREKTALLNIIGALVEVMQTPRSGRESDAAVIRELVENYGDKHGISQSNLDRKIPEAKRSLHSD